MSKTLTCPDCGVVNHLPEDHDDTFVKCFECGYVFSTTPENSVWQRPAAYDGIISGVLAGLLAGSLVGTLSGAFQEGAGGAVGGALFGIVIGVAFGTLGGALTAVLGEHLVPALGRPRQATMVAGFFAGAVVAAIVGHGQLVWLLPGIVVGMLAANLWSKVRHGIAV